MAKDLLHPTMESITLKREKYRQAILSFLESEAKVPAVIGKIERKIVADEQRGEYLLVNTGWRGTLHIDSIIYHFEIKPDGKIWIHANWTDQLIDEDLAELGVDPNDLVLGFVPDYYRALAAPH